MKTRQHFSRKSLSAKTGVLISAIALLVFSSCKPSTEGETASWKTNTAGLAQLQTEMPQFADALTAVKTRAEAAWTEAGKISDDDKKAEAMKAANDIIKKGFAGQMMEVPKLQDEIQGIRDKLDGKTMSQSIIDKLSTAVESTDEANEDWDTAIESGATDEASANTLIGPAYDAVLTCAIKWRSIETDYDNYKRKKK